MTSWSPRSKPRTRSWEQLFAGQGWGLTRYRDDETWGTLNPRGPVGCAPSIKNRIGWDSLLSDIHRDQRVTENFSRRVTREKSPRTGAPQSCQAQPWSYWGTLLNAPFDLAPSSHAPGTLGQLHRNEIRKMSRRSNHYSVHPRLIQSHIKCQL